MIESNVCGKYLEHNEVGWRCRECETHNTSIQCNSCFKASEHEGHNYFAVQCQGGMCDCGDESSWKKEGFCTQHNGDNRDLQGTQLYSVLLNQMQLPHPTSLMRLFHEVSLVYASYLGKSENADNVNKIRLINMVLSIYSEVGSVFNSFISICYMYPNYRIEKDEDYTKILETYFDISYFGYDHLMSYLSRLKHVIYTNELNFSPLQVQPVIYHIVDIIIEYKLSKEDLNLFEEYMVKKLSFIWFKTCFLNKYLEFYTLDSYIIKNENSEYNSIVNSLYTNLAVQVFPHETILKEIFTTSPLKFTTYFDFIEYCICSSYQSGYYTIISQYKNNYSYIYQAISDIDKFVSVQSVQNLIYNTDVGFTFLKKFIDFIYIFEKVFYITQIEDFKPSEQDMYRQIYYVEIVVKTFNQMLGNIKQATDEIVLKILEYMVRAICSNYEDMKAKKAISLYSPLIQCINKLFEYFIEVHEEDRRIVFSIRLTNLLKQIDKTKVEAVYRCAYDTLILNAEIKGQLQLFWKYVYEDLDLIFQIRSNYISNRNDYFGNLIGIVGYLEEIQGYRSNNVINYSITAFINNYQYKDNFDSHKAPKIDEMTDRFELIYSKFSKEKLIPYHNFLLRITFEKYFYYEEIKLVKYLGQLNSIYVLPSENLYQNLIVDKLKLFLMTGSIEFDQFIEFIKTYKIIDEKIIRKSVDKYAKIKLSNDKVFIYPHSEHTIDGFFDTTRFRIVDNEVKGLMGEKYSNLLKKDFYKYFTGKDDYHFNPSRYSITAITQDLEEWWNVMNLHLFMIDFKEYEENACYDLFLLYSKFICNLYLNLKQDIIKTYIIKWAESLSKYNSDSIEMKCILKYVNSSLEQHEEVEVAKILSDKVYLKYQEMAYQKFESMQRDYMREHKMHFKLKKRKSTLKNTPLSRPSTSPTNHASIESKVEDFVSCDEDAQSDSVGNSKSEGYFSCESDSEEINSMRKNDMICILCNKDLKYEDFILYFCFVNSTNLSSELLLNKAIKFQEFSREIEDYNHGNYLYFNTCRHYIHYNCLVASYKTIKLEHKLFVDKFVNLYEFTCKYCNILMNTIVWKMDFYNKFEVSLKEYYLLFEKMGSIAMSGFVEFRKIRADQVKEMNTIFLNDSIFTLCEIVDYAKVSKDAVTDLPAFYPKLLAIISKTYYGMINEVEIKSLNPKVCNSLISFGYYVRNFINFSFDSNSQEFNAFVGVFYTQLCASMEEYDVVYDIKLILSGGKFGIKNIISKIITMVTQFIIYEYDIKGVNGCQVDLDSFHEYNSSYVALISSINNYLKKLVALNLIFLPEVHYLLQPVLQKLNHPDNSELDEFKILLGLFSLEAIYDLKAYIIANKPAIQQLKEKLDTSRLQLLSRKQSNYVIAISLVHSSIPFFPLPASIVDLHRDWNIHYCIFCQKNSSKISMCLKCGELVCVGNKERHEKHPSYRSRVTKSPAVDHLRKCCGGSGMLLDTFKGDVTLYTRGRLVSMHLYLNEFGIFERDFEYLRKHVKNEYYYQKIYDMYINNEVAQESYNQIKKTGYYLNMEL